MLGGIHFHTLAAFTQNDFLPIHVFLPVVSMNLASEVLSWRSDLI